MFSRSLRLTITATSSYPGFSRLGLKTDFDQFTPKRPICGHVTHVTPVRRLRGSSFSLAGQGLSVKGVREHNGTTIESIAFLIACAWYTILSIKCADQGNTSSPNPSKRDSKPHEPPEHPSQCERQLSRKQSRRRCW